MEFLYDGEVKLFRSPTEGNMLIRVMDASLTPNQQVGRYLWSFSATAYEIAEHTYENLNKYNFLSYKPPIRFISSFLHVNFIIVNNLSQEKKLGFL